MDISLESLRYYGEAIRRHQDYPGKEVIVQEFVEHVQGRTDLTDGTRRELLSLLSDARVC